MHGDRTPPIRGEWQRYRRGWCTEKVVEAVPGVWGNILVEGGSAFQAEGTACPKAPGTTQHDVSGWRSASPLVCYDGMRRVGG